MPPKKNDDVEAFQTRLDKIQSDLDPLTSKVTGIETQGDKLTELLSTAAEEVAVAAAQDADEGVVGKGLKAFEMAKHTKAALAEGAKLAKSATKIEASAREVVKSAQTAKGKCDDLSTDISTYLRKHGKKVPADDKKALEAIKKAAERLSDRFVTRVVQPANAAVLSEQDYAKTFKVKAEDAVDDIKGTIAKQQAEIDAMSLEPRILAKKIGAVKTANNSFMEHAKAARESLTGAVKGSDAESSALDEIKAAQACTAEMLALHKAVIGDLSEVKKEYSGKVDIEGKDLWVRFQKSDSYKSAIKLSNRISEYTDKQKGVLDVLQQTLDGLPPPKNPLPPGVKKVIGAKTEAK